MLRSRIQPGNRRIGVNLGMFENGQRLLNTAAIHTAAQEAAARRLQAERDVGFDAQVGRQRQFLVDHGDAATARVLRAGRVVGSAVERHRARIGSNRPAQHFHQRRFAGAVLADESMDFAGTQFQVNAVESLGRAEALADVGHRQANGDGHGSFLV